MSQLATHSPFPLKKKNLCYSFPPWTPISHTKSLEKSQKRLGKSSEKVWKRKRAQLTLYSAVEYEPSWHKDRPKHRHTYERLTHVRQRWCDPPAPWPGGPSTSLYWIDPPLRLCNDHLITIDYKGCVQPMRHCNISISYSVYFIFHDPFALGLCTVYYSFLRTLLHIDIYFLRI